LRACAAARYPSPKPAYLTDEDIYRVAL